MMPPSVSKLKNEADNFVVYLTRLSVFVHDSGSFITVGYEK